MLCSQGSSRSDIFDLHIYLLVQDGVEGHILPDDSHKEVWVHPYILLTKPNMQMVWVHEPDLFGFQLQPFQFTALAVNHRHLDVFILLPLHVDDLTPKWGDPIRHESGFCLFGAPVQAYFKSGIQVKIETSVDDEF